jgi:CRISPR type I-E-associated protein CasB/Cse2
MASDVSDTVRDGATAGETTRKDAVASIAGQIPKLANGDRALLRRLYLTQSSSSRSYQADGIVIGLLHRAGVTAPERMATYEPWRLLAHVAALLSGTGTTSPHVPRGSLGRALHQAGYSENRLLRLTAARGPALADQVIRAARVIAQAGASPVDLWTVFDLVGRDPERAENARLLVARDYYAAEARKKGETK